MLRFMILSLLVANAVAFPAEAILEPEARETPLNLQENEISQPISGKNELQELSNPTMEDSALFEPSSKVTSEVEPELLDTVNSEDEQSIQEPEAQASETPIEEEIITNSDTKSEEPDTNINVDEVPENLDTKPEVLEIEPSDDQVKVETHNTGVLPYQQSQNEAEYFEEPHLEPVYTEDFEPNMRDEPMLDTYDEYSDVPFFREETHMDDYMDEYTDDSPSLIEPYQSSQFDMVDYAQDGPEALEIPHNPENHATATDVTENHEEYLETEPEGSQNFNQDDLVIETSGNDEEQMNEEIEDFQQPNGRYAPLYSEQNYGHRFDMNPTAEEDQTLDYPTYDQGFNYEQYDENTGNFDSMGFNDQIPQANQYEAYNGGSHSMDHHLDEPYSLHDSGSYIRTDHEEPHITQDSDHHHEITSYEPTRKDIAFDYDHHGNRDVPFNFFNYMHRSVYPGFQESYHQPSSHIIIYKIKGNLPLLFPTSVKPVPNQEKPEKSETKQKLEMVKLDGTPKKSKPQKRNTEEYKTLKRSPVQGNKVDHDLRDQFVFQNSPFHNGGGRPFYDSRQQIPDESFNRNRYPSVTGGSYANLDPYGLNYNDQAYLYSALNRDNRLRYLLHRVFGI